VQGDRQDARRRWNKSQNPPERVRKGKYNAETQTTLRIRREEMREGDVEPPYTAGNGLNARTCMTRRIDGV
jgi:hypothetical protein